MIMETKNITIVGGGSAGWMSATILLNQFPDKHITVVEDPNIPTVGVGESTVSGEQSGFNGIGAWLKLLEIKDSDWMHHCDAIHKLSIRFENWYREDSGHFHYPFGTPTLSKQSTEYENSSQMPYTAFDWQHKKLFYPETPASDFADTFWPVMALVNQNKALHSIDLSDPKNRNDGRFGWAYQFDATKFGIWLRDNYCKTKYADRFTHIQAEVKEIPLDEDGIKHLVLDNGQKLEADLFIDCTGFKSLLLTKAFEVPFIPISDIIPNNYAWATKIPYTDPETQIVNYTNCTAIENGWIWEIPLWSRMGSGYVFSDKFISTDAALREFKYNLLKKGYENVEDLDYHLIPMRCGVQSKLWVKNTLAIGLSAGFIEPLQSNGLQSIYQFLFNLVKTLKRGRISEWDRREYTAKCHDDFYECAHVVAFTYVLSHRDDTEYWRDILNRDYPEDMFTNISTGISKGFHREYVSKNFQIDLTGAGIHAVAAGMNWYPIDKLEPLLDNQKDNKADFFSYVLDSNGKKLEYSQLVKEWTEKFIQHTEERKRMWNEEIKDFPSPYQYSKDSIHKNA
jgi:tryptophan halogenase